LWPVGLALSLRYLVTVSNRGAALTMTDGVSLADCRGGVKLPHSLT